MSFHQLCHRQVARADRESGRDLLAEAKLTYPGKNLYDVQLPNALTYSLDVLPERYEAIICDEGQDFREEFWVPLDLLLADYERSPLYVFYDDNQNIYARASTFPIQGEPFSLTTNCRNTAPIHTAAYTRYRGVPVSPPDNEGAEVQFDQAPSRAAQARKINARIVELIARQGVSPGDIAVLIVDAVSKADYYAALRRLPLPKPATWLEEGRSKRPHGPDGHGQAFQGPGSSRGHPVGPRRHRLGAKRGIALRGYEPGEVPSGGRWNKRELHNGQYGLSSDEWTDLTGVRRSSRPGRSAVRRTDRASVKRQQIGIKPRRVILALRTSGVYPLQGSEAPSMFTRKHLLRWLTTPCRRPDPLSEFRSVYLSTQASTADCTYAPPGKVVRARRHWEASGSQQSARRLSSAHPQPLRNICVKKNCQTQEVTGSWKVFRIIPYPEVLAARSGRKKKWPSIPLHWMAKNPMRYKSTVSTMFWTPRIKSLQMK